MIQQQKHLSARDLSPTNRYNPKVKQMALSTLNQSSEGFTKDTQETSNATKSIDDKSDNLDKASSTLEGSVSSRVLKTIQTDFKRLEKKKRFSKLWKGNGGEVSGGWWFKKFMCYCYGTSLPGESLKKGDDYLLQLRIALVVPKNNIDKRNLNKHLRL